MQYLYKYILKWLLKLKNWKELKFKVTKGQMWHLKKPLEIYYSTELFQFPSINWIWTELFSSLTLGSCVALKKAIRFNLGQQTSFHGCSESFFSILITFGWHHGFLLERGLSSPFRQNRLQLLCFIGNNFQT